MTKIFNGTLKVTFLDCLDETLVEGGLGERRKHSKVFVASVFHSSRFDCAPALQESLVATGIPLWVPATFLEIDMRGQKRQQLHDANLLTAQCGSANLSSAWFNLWHWGDARKIFAYKSPLSVLCCKWEITNHHWVCSVDLPRFNVFLYVTLKPSKLLTKQIMRKLDFLYSFYKKICVDIPKMRFNNE